MWDFKNILKEIMVENIPNLAEDINLLIQEDEQTPNRVYAKEIQAKTCLSNFSMLKTKQF